MKKIRIICLLKNCNFIFYKYFLMLDHQWNFTWCWKIVISYEWDVKNINKKFHLRPTLHTIFLNTIAIKRYCDKKIKKTFFHPIFIFPLWFKNIYFLTIMLIETSFKIFLSRCLFIFFMQYFVQKHCVWREPNNVNCFQILIQIYLLIR